MGIEYIQFISIAFIVLVHISISVPYKETIEDIGEISNHKLIHENAISMWNDTTYSQQFICIG